MQIQSWEGAAWSCAEAVRQSSRVGRTKSAGRRTLLLARSDSRTISQLFPEIAKLQVHHYQTHLSLEKTVEQFLTRA